MVLAEHRFVFSALKSYNLSTCIVSEVMSVKTAHDMMQRAFKKEESSLHLVSHICQKHVQHETTFHVQ